MNFRQMAQILLDGGVITDNQNIDYYLNHNGDLVVNEDPPRVMRYSIIPDNVHVKKRSKNES